MNTGNAWIALPVFLDSYGKKNMYFMWQVLHS